MRRVALLLIVGTVIGAAEPLQPPTPGSTQPTQSPSSLPTGKSAATQFDQRGTEQFPFVVKTFSPPKTPEQTAEDKAERDDRSAADWWMVRLTGLIAFIGIGQGCVFYTQARRLRKTIDTMEATEKRQLRAYVGIERLEVSSSHLTSDEYEKPTIAPGTYWEDVIFVYAKNFGQTAANTITAHVSWWQMPWPQNLPATFAYADITSPTNPDVVTVPPRFYLDGGQSDRLLIPINDMTDFRRAFNK